jgi:hypothetical protein
MVVVPQSGTAGVLQLFPGAWKGITNDDRRHLASGRSIIEDFGHAGTMRPTLRRDKRTGAGANR